jgi:serine/threonine-protein kinase
MSPEQASGDRVDHRSDLYSLGCVLYEMLAGRPPFSGPSAQAIRARHMQEPMPGIRVVRPTVSRRLEGVVAKALAKVPADRFASARAMQEALRNPAVLLPDTDAEPIQGGGRPWYAHRRVWTVAGGVATVALALATWRAGYDRMRALDTHRVVGFPLTASGELGSGAGEDMATLMGSALDRRESLRWVDGWQGAGEGEPSPDEMKRTARRAGARWFLAGRIIARGDSTDVLLELVDVAGDSVAARPRASGPRQQLWQTAIRSVNQLLPVLIPGTEAKDFERGWIDREPGAVASFLAGEAAFRRAQPGVALGHYREAMRLDSSFALAAVRAAQAATADHRPEEARALVTRAVALPMAPQYAEFTRGYVAYLEGRADSAVASFRRALQLDADLTAAWAQLGETYVHLVSRDTLPEGAAWRAFEEARRQDTTAAHLLLHPLEIAWRRGDRAQGEALTTRFLSARPDSQQAVAAQLVADCARTGAARTDWRRAMRVPLAVLSSGAVMAASPSLAECALGAYAAVRLMDTVPAGQTDVDVTARRQSAQLGELALLAQLGRAREAIRLIEESMARGEGGGSLLVFAAALDSAFAPSALAIVQQDIARFGPDLSGCTSAARCWILAAYHGLRGDSIAARGAASSPALVPSATTPPHYADAARAYAQLAAGDSSGARETLATLLTRPFPPGALLTWFPISGYGLERIVLARLYLAQGRPAEARQVVATVRAPGPVVFPLFRQAAGEVDAQARRMRPASVAIGRRAR